MKKYLFLKEGEDVIVDETARINQPQLVEIGDHVAIDIGVYISTSAKIGDYIHIAPYTCIIGGKDSRLIMGDFSGISGGCKILCGSDDFTNGLIGPQIPIEYRRPKISHVTFEPFSCIGANTVVMPGVTLSEGSVVGANSVLTSDTDPWTIYVGSPAKPVKVRDKELILKYARELGYEY